MNLLYLISEYPKVSHSFVRREIEALVADGHVVDRIAIRGWDLPLADPADVAERARTTYVLGQGWGKLMGATLREAVRRPAAFKRALGLAWRMSKKADRSLPYHLMYLMEASWIARHIEGAGHDHLHAHFGTNPAEVATLVSVLTGLPFSFTAHGPDEFDRPEALHLRDKVAQAAFVVTVSAFGRSQMWRWVDHADWPKVKVVHCGLDATFLTAPASSAPAVPRLVCVGRLSGQKGQLLLIEAAGQLKRQGVPFELVLAGDGEMRPDIERAIAQWQLADCVRITGWLSAAQVRDELLAARALVLPSFAEGLPVVVMEAMAQGRPVLSTYIAGMPELVQPGRTGWLVPAGDVDALVEAMKTCLATPADVLAAMGQAARERAAARHDVRTEARKLAAHIEAHRAGRAKAGQLPAAVTAKVAGGVEMLALINLILIGAAVLMLLPVCVFAVQVLAALCARPVQRGAPPARGPVAILMPAHDEAVVIRDTLQRLKPHLQAGDRVLVVADNCTDDTAAIARSEGAEVTERFNTSQRGKGYALDHGVRELAQNPPACVVVVDADCALHDGALNWLADSVARTGRPTQALYLMDLAPGSRAVSPVAVFAWRVRNLVRPLGMHVLGGPCHLTGSGMALPWALLRDLPLASGHIVEDMKMGVDLARAGHPPLFCREALVTSTFAVSQEGAQAQRTRWEHGTLGMIFAEVPKMVGEALRGRGRGLLPLALDMVPPPLALLGLLLLSLTIVTSVWHASCMFTVASYLSLIETILFALALLAAWWKFGRDIVSPAQVPALVAYTLGKVPLYLRFLVKRQMVWVRSKRDSD